MNSTEGFDLSIRRNDYIAAIRSDITEVNVALGMYQDLKREAYELIAYCKENHLWRFRRVAKYELKLLNKKHRWQKRQLKRLQKLLYKAEKYTPGTRRE